MEMFIDLKLSFTDVLKVNIFKGTFRDLIIMRSIN